MRTRILGPEEWDRLRSVGMMPLLPYVHPANVAVIVVEQDGEIIGSLGVLRAPHYEGLWVEPKQRANPTGIIRALLRQAGAVAKMWGDGWILGAAARDDGEMHSYLSRLGGAQVPIDLFALKIGETSCPYQ